MEEIIDSRVRLPNEFHPEQIEGDTDLYYSQYDAVLGLSEYMDKTLEELKKEMVTSDVSHAIIHAEYEYGDPADFLNEQVGYIVQNEPNLFSGFGTISMENIRPMKAIKQLEKVKELGLLGINIQPAFFNIPIDDKKLYPVYSKAVELNLSVAIHTGINYSLAHPIKNEHPLLLDQIASDFPNLRIIACHATWPWVPEAVAVARKHPNILFDFGGLSPKYIKKPGSGWEVMYQFMNNLLSDQILFATDWPVFSMNRSIKEWKNLKLKEEVLSKLFNQNVKKILHG